MSYQLKPDPSGLRDFVTTPGAEVTIFADSDSGLVRIIAATLNNAAQPIDPSGKTTWQAVSGINLLDLAFAGPDPEEVFRIQSQCAGSSAQTLSTWKLQSGNGTPGGPSRAFRIYAQ